MSISENVVTLHVKRHAHVKPKFDLYVNASGILMCDGVFPITALPLLRQLAADTGATVRETKN